MGFGDLLGMFGATGGPPGGLSSGMGQMPVNFGQMVPRPAPGLDSADFSTMPQMAKPSPLAAIGDALAKGAHNQTPPLQAQQAYAPQQAPIDMGLLQQLLASIGQGRR